MKILVLGSDGRAHALVWKLFSSAAADLLIAPGNGGATLLAPQVELDPQDVVEVARWAFSEGIELIIPAETGPLAAGLVDEVVTMQIGVCGPPQRATPLERSRCYARAFLERYGLPLARGRVCTDLATAEKYLAAMALPVVVKADRPELGTGVYLDRYSALEALRNSFLVPSLDGPVAGLVIEEHLAGPVFSLTALTDGTTAIPLRAVRLYDQLGPEPDSPLAPGMGAFVSSSVYARRLTDLLHTRVIQPIIAALAREGLPYWGFLGVDCIVTEQGPRLIGLRCSLRDLEAQVVLPLLEGDLLPVIEATIARRLDRFGALNWRDESCVALGLVAQGYPHHFPTGGLIEGLSELDEGVLVFHSQTHNPGGMRYAPSSRGGNLLAGLLMGSGSSNMPAGISVNGGHVLSVVATGATLAGARGRALLNAERIRFPGRTFREDVAAHEFR
ncbi:MAG: phosphoribosylamine--glycine ligase [Oscillochloridaceae bacterium umkhey_bin13]